MDKNYQIVYAFIAYDNADLLERKIKFLYTSEDFFIVHWNRYSSGKKLRRLQEAFKDYENVHIYSKVKVVWGLYSILLAMLENMKLALRLAGEFDHFISLSEQCAPVKTKAYIKEHLAKYRGKSFLPSHYITPYLDTSSVPYNTNVGVLTGHFCGLHVRNWLPFFWRWHMYLHAGWALVYNFIPIIKNRKQTWQKMKEASSYRALREARGIKKKFLLMKYILVFPFRFLAVSLYRGGCVGLYGKVSKLYDLCADGQFCITKNAGPAGCYCREDVEYLCRMENVQLARSMRRYHAPEEYFCQTVLYNNPMNRRNFLNETLCATDYLPGGEQGVLRYLDPKEFLDEPLNLSTQELLAMPPGNWIKTFKYEHVCFLRKIADPKIYDVLESCLMKQAEKEQIHRNS